MSNLSLCSLYTQHQSPTLTVRHLILMPPLAICLWCYGPEWPIHQHKRTIIMSHCVAQCVACLCVFQEAHHDGLSPPTTPCTFINTKGPSAILWRLSVQDGSRRLTLTKQARWNRWGDEASPELLSKARVPAPRLLPALRPSWMAFAVTLRIIERVFQHHLSNSWCHVAP